MIGGFGEPLTSDKLSVFSCSRNTDVESFIRTKAIRFEKTHNARTYLILDEEDESGNIYGYFSLSFKEVILQSEEISKAKIKKLDGISKNAQKIRVFLIGQLAKDDKLPDNKLNLSRILDLVYPIILDVQDSIGGRVLLLECEDSPRLISFYQGSGFEILQTDDLVQMYMFVDELKLES